MSNLPDTTTECNQTVANPDNPQSKLTLTEAQTAALRAARSGDESQLNDLPLHEQALIDHVHLGVESIPVNRSDKKPIGFEWQFQTVDPNDYETTLKDVNRGLHWTADVVDVDIDAPAALDFAYLLPTTPAVFGRESNPCSHHLFRAPGAKYVKLIDPDSGTIVEIRAGRGKQTVAPGSVHPSGERVRWDGYGVPGQVDADALLRCVQRLAAAAVLSMTGLDGAAIAAVLADPATKLRDVTLSPKRKAKVSAWLGVRGHLALAATTTPRESASVKTRVKQLAASNDDRKDQAFGIGNKIGIAAATNGEPIESARERACVEVERALQEGGREYGPEHLQQSDRGTEKGYARGVGIRSISREAVDEALGTTACAWTAISPDEAREEAAKGFDVGERDRKMARVGARLARSKPATKCETRIDTTFTLTAVHCNDAARALNRKQTLKSQADKRAWLALGTQQKPECDLPSTLQLIHDTYPAADAASVADHLEPIWPDKADVAAAFAALQAARAERSTALAQLDARILRDDDDQIMATPANVQLLVTESFVKRGKLRRNARGDYMQCRGLPWDAEHSDDWREWTQDDYGHLVVWLQSKFGIVMAAYQVAGPVKTASSSCTVDPFLEYIESTPEWDGTPRLDFWLTRVFGGEPTTYTKAALRCYVLQTVARASRPGCQAELKLVLVGAQGLGKSSSLEILVGSAFFNNNLGDKKESRTDELMRLHRCVWHEDQEMSGYSRREVNADKAHISTKADMYRSPYDDAPRLHLRRFLECASHNPNEGVGFLRDSTGGRRYLPFVCTQIADREWLTENRDQIWAEAVHRFNAHVAADDLGPDQITQWWLTDAEEAEAKAVQEEHTERDPWAEVLQLEAAKPIRPKSIDDISASPTSGAVKLKEWGRYSKLSERDCVPEQLRNGDGKDKHLTKLSIGQALTLLGIERPERSQQTRAAEALRAIGCAFAGRENWPQGKVSVYTLPTTRSAA